MNTLISVRPALDNPGTPYEIEGTFELPRLVVSNWEYRIEGPARYHVTATEVGDGIYVTGDVSLATQTDCALCLRPFPVELNGRIEQLFTHDYTEDSEGEPLPQVTAEGEIPLLEELEEILRLAAPFAPLHDQDCKGLCPTCGIDRNEGTCQCSQKVDENHPFAQLKDLINESDQ